MKSETLQGSTCLQKDAVSAKPRKWQRVCVQSRKGASERISIWIYARRGAATVRHWLNATSPAFSALCGERFTHKEVLIAHLAAAALIAACCLAEHFEKGGAL